MSWQKGYRKKNYDKRHGAQTQSELNDETAVWVRTGDKQTRGRIIKQLTPQDPTLFPPLEASFTKIANTSYHSPRHSAGRTFRRQ